MGCGHPTLVLWMDCCDRVPYFMVSEFRALESMTLAVPPRGVPISTYLRQPLRLIAALREQSRVELLRKVSPSDPGPIPFRLVLRPLQFFQLSIQPTVDMEVWAERDGTVHLRSTHTEIRGVPVGREFRLHLTGYIRAQQGRSPHLCGKMELSVRLQIPPLLAFIPPRALEAAIENLMRNVLLSMKQRLMRRLIADYEAWVDERTSTSLEALNL